MISIVLGSNLRCHLEICYRSIWGRKKRRQEKGEGKKKTQPNNPVLFLITALILV